MSIELLSTPEQIRALVAELRAEKIIAFDTEFIRESTFYPIVEIIQVATRSKAWIVDAQVFKKGFRPGPRGGYDPGIQPLLDVFTDPSILKVIHAAQGDQECLYTSFGITAVHSVDTAVAASLCGLGEGLGLGKLLKLVLDIEIKKGHARTNWSVRPLPDQLLEYALEDVRTLVEMGEKLLKSLEPLGRQAWAMEVSSQWEAHSKFETDIDELVMKLGKGGRLSGPGLAALYGLVRWREDRVRQLNLPRRWVADDAILIDLAQVRPKDMEHLSAFRGLNKGELKNSGEAILKAIHQTVLPESFTVPKSRRPEIPSTEESQVLDLIKCYVGILADKNRIASKHLMLSAQALPLLRGKIESVDDLKKAGVLSGEALTLVGQDLLELLQGRRALAIHGTQIRIVEVKNS